MLTGGRSVAFGVPEQRAYCVPRIASKPWAGDACKGRGLLCACGSWASGVLCTSGSWASGARRSCREGRGAHRWALSGTWGARAAWFLCATNCVNALGRSCLQGKGAAMPMWILGLGDAPHLALGLRGCPAAEAPIIWLSGLRGAQELRGQVGAPFHWGCPSSLGIVCQELRQSLGQEMPARQGGCSAHLDLGHRGCPGHRPADRRARTDALGQALRAQTLSDKRPLGRRSGTGTLDRGLWADALGQTLSERCSGHSHSRTDALRTDALGRTSGSWASGQTLWHRGFGQRPSDRRSRTGSLGAITLG